MKRSQKPLILGQSSAAPMIASVIMAMGLMVGGVIFTGPNTSVQADNLDIIASETELSEDTYSYAGNESTSLPRALEVSSVTTIPVITDPLPYEIIEIADATYVDQENYGPRIALIIDDVGMNSVIAQRIIDLDANLTLAILPYAESAQSISLNARNAGHDVLVHVPMEPVGLADPGPNALLVRQGDDEIQARVQWSMAQVPGAVGLNNHMGSRFTRDPHALHVALSAVGVEQNFFLDSKTVGDSRGASIARGLGMSVLERDLFIDHEINAAAISAQLSSAERISRERGWAVIIGHPHDITLTLLEAWIEEAQDRGITFVTVSALANQLEQENTSWTQASLN